VRSALEWAQVRALAADGISQREIASRLGINRRTVARLLAREEPPRYRREGREYSCRASGGGPVVLVDESAEPVSTVNVAD
jgi:transposase